MSRIGRPALPTNLRVLEGNRGRRPIRNSPKPPIPADMPKPPKFLHRYAVEEWERIAPELYEMGILTNIDRASLGAACQAYARWRLAEEKLATAALADKDSAGLVSKTAAGNVIMNPLLTTANGAMRDYIRFMAEFGMSPSARARIEVKRGEEEDPIGRKFFGR